MRRMRLGALLGVSLTLLSVTALAGDLPIKGLFKGDPAPKPIEDGLLATDLDTLRGVRARTALWVFATESRADWDRVVAAGLDEALSRSPEELERFARSLPRGVTVLGPDIAGARVRFELPEGRGSGAVALALPPVIKQGMGESSLLNSRAPNQGRFLSAVDVRRPGDGADLVTAVYAPSTPRPLVGAAPEPNYQDVPGGGRGELVLWAGRRARDGDAGDLRDELTGWLKRDDLPTQPMRSFPGRESELARTLRSFRVPVDVPVGEDGWYRTLSIRPGDWEMERRRVKHPARTISGAAPVSARVERDGRVEEHELIVGFVALYEPLLLTPEEAAIAAGGDGKRFFEAVHRGELPFLRDRDDIWFLRAHVERWLDGRAKKPEGKARTWREAVKLLRYWGDKYRLKSADRIARQPLPFRYEAIPADELEEMVDRRRAARGRVFTEDLSAWAQHMDPRFDKGDLEPAYVLGKPRGGADAKLALRATPQVGPQSRPRPTDPEDPTPDDGAVAASDGPKKDKELVKASDLGYGGRETDEETVDLDFELEDRGWEDGGDDGGARATYGMETGRMGGSVGGAGPEVITGVSLRDVYAVSSVCRVGGVAEAGIEVRIAGLGEDVEQELRIEWDLIQGGRSLRRDAFSEVRGDGVHEIEFDVACPDGGAEAEVVVAVFLGDDSDEGTLPLEVRSGSGRSFAKLSMPPAKRCLDVDLSVDGDEDFGVATSRGLSPSEIGDSVRSFQEQTLRCFDAVPDASGTVQVELTVGCDGRVSAVELMDETIGDADFVACVVDTMRYAPFPAHDREGGVVFELPLRYE